MNQSLDKFHTPYSNLFDCSHPPENQYNTATKRIRAIFQIITLKHGICYKKQNTIIEKSRKRGKPIVWINMIDSSSILNSITKISMQRS